MLTLKDIIDLSLHYKMPFEDLNDKSINEIVTSAIAEKKKIVKSTEKNPVFFTHLILSYLDREVPGTFDRSRLKVKNEYFKQTILEIQRIWKLESSQTMLSFLQDSMSFKFTYRKRFINLKDIVYYFNTLEELTELIDLCSLYYLKNTFTEIENPETKIKTYKLTIYF